MACSATLPKATLAYIHKSLHLESPTVLCDMPTDRSNITLFTAPIPKGQTESMAPLLDLVPGVVATWDPERFGDEQWSPLDIPKTLVFIDDKNACCILTTLLINRFPKHLRKSDARDVVCEYHSTMSQKALDRNLQALRDGICRIMVCTDAVGMGLDVPDIQRIVQWKVPQWLTVAGWWQRAGRAARNPDVEGIATVYYEPSFRVAPDSPFCGRADVEEDMELVHVAMTDGATPTDDEEASSAAAGTRRNKKKGSLPCEGQLLWYLNTKGCIREVAMHYLGSQIEPRAAFNEHDMGAPCCCRCYKESGQNPDSFVGFPVRSCTPFMGTEPDANADDVVDAEEEDTQPGNDDQSQIISKGVRGSKKRIQLAMRLALNIWRHRALLNLLGSDRMLRAKHILSDSMITRLEAKCSQIKQAADVTSAISGPGRDVIRYTRIANNTAEMAELIVGVVSSATAPDLPHRARNAPYTPGLPKPLFSDNDIELTLIPKVAQMMRDANNELRQFDLDAVAAKERIRIRRKTCRAQGSQQPGSIVSATESVAGSINTFIHSQVFSQADTESIDGSIFSQEFANTQQTDRDLMPPPSLPIKRGRGRPRKITGPGSVASSAPSVASDASDEPPKKRQTRTDSSAGTQLQPESSADAHAVKRGRGRPRGSKNRPKQQPTARPRDEVSEQQHVPAIPDEPGPSEFPDASFEGEPTQLEQSADDQIQGASSDDAPIVKRGRGRPRGSKNRPKQLTQPHSIDPSADSSQNPSDNQGS
jgi:hypothetical protein